MRMLLDPHEHVVAVRRVNPAVTVTGRIRRDAAGLRIMAVAVRDGHWELAKEREKIECRQSESARWIGVENKEQDSLPENTSVVAYLADAATLTICVAPCAALVPRPQGRLHRRRADHRLPISMSKKKAGSGIATAARCKSMHRNGRGRCWVWALDRDTGRAILPSVLWPFPL